MAPFLAAVLAFTSRVRLSYGLLGAAMFGSLAFGVYHHYVGISPDHVAHLPPGSEQGLFKQTAWLMAAAEAAGLGFAAWALLRRTSSVQR